MAKDPAFLFYPGDYLRDTQCLSENTQVAYDRIMCEHMRNTSNDMNNITISQEKLNFFSKRLSEDERQELFTVLEKKNGGYQIYWVAESIADRRLYSESRSKNRSKKNESHENISKHMEDEIENTSEDEIINTVIDEKLLIPQMFSTFKKHNSKYPADVNKDYKPLMDIAKFLHQQSGLNGNVILNQKVIMEEWDRLCVVIEKDKFYKSKSLSVISNQIQEIFQISKNGSAKQTDDTTRFNAGAKELFNRLTGKT